MPNMAKSVPCMQCCISCYDQSAINSIDQCKQIATTSTTLPISNRIISGFITVRIINCEQTTLVTVTQIVILALWTISTRHRLSFQSVWKYTHHLYKTVLTHLKTKAGKCDFSRLLYAKPPLKFVLDTTGVPPTKSLASTNYMIDVHHALSWCHSSVGVVLHWN